MGIQESSQITTKTELLLTEMGRLQEELVWGETESSLLDVR